MGLSVGRIRQLEKSALKKMRVLLTRQGITAEDVRAIRQHEDTFKLIDR